MCVVILVIDSSVCVITLVIDSTVCVVTLVIEGTSWGGARRVNKERKHSKTSN